MGVSKIIGLFFKTLVTLIALSLIVIFQPEIRNVLESIGRTQLLGRHKTLTVDEREKLVYEVMNAVEYLRKTRIGALIVIEREMSLNEYIEPATKVYADLTDDLLNTIFFPNSPLHDGGVIVQGDRITCAGDVFKTSMDGNINKRVGTRHRAGIGVTETIDVMSLIVSEESGIISVARTGKITRYADTETLKRTLGQYYWQELESARKFAKENEARAEAEVKEIPKYKSR